MLQGKHISLDPRLSLIAEMAGKCSCLADIGCDHGRLSAFMLQRGWAQRAYLSDVSAVSLNKAGQLLALCGLSDRAVLEKTDGLDGLPESADCIVISGMGGKTVSGILLRGRERLNGARLILQPNVAIPETRDALQVIGYAITDERIVLDGRRMYVTIRAEQGSMMLDEKERTVGPVLLRDRPAALGEYAAFRVRVLRDALKGADRSSGAGIAKDGIERELRIWEEVGRLRPALVL